METLWTINNSLGATAFGMEDYLSAQGFYEKSVNIFELLIKEMGTIQVYSDYLYALFMLGICFYNNSIKKRFGLFKYIDKQLSERAKTTLERVVEIGMASSDDYLSELGKKARDILDNYF